MPSSSPTMFTKCTIIPDQKSTIQNLKLSVSDLPMLSCHYIQKGCLFTKPSIPFHNLIPIIKAALSRTLSIFPPLAGRLTTDSDGYVYLTSNDAGVDFITAIATELYIHDLLSTTDINPSFKEFFTFDRKVSYSGHFSPIMAVQVTELADGVFIGCSVNHAVTDGTSFWNFFNTFAQICRGANKCLRNPPSFRRDSVLISNAILRLPKEGPAVTFNADAPIRERIFSFNREAIQKLKAKANNRRWIMENNNAVELMQKHMNDQKENGNGKVAALIENWFKNNVNPKQPTVTVTESETETVTESETETVEISSFQSLCALLWRAITRARKFHPTKTTTFRMAVNCRHRVEPRIEPFYFGNAIQSVPTYASAGEVVSRDIRWCAMQLNKNVKAHDNVMVRKCVEEWEKNPRCFPLGNSDGGSITMGSSPRFPMYDNDFGWGKPLAVRSGKANKFDGKISAFPGRDGSGSVDLEVVLAPETMAGLENDAEFMVYATRQL